MLSMLRYSGTIFIVGTMALCGMSGIVTPPLHADSARAAEPAQTKRHLEGMEKAALIKEFDWKPIDSKLRAQIDPIAKVAMERNLSSDVLVHRFMGKKGRYILVLDKTNDLLLFLSQRDVSGHTVEVGGEIYNGRVATFKFPADAEGAKRAKFVGRTLAPEVPAHKAGS